MLKPDARRLEPDSFYSNALPRIRRFMIVIAVAATLAALLAFRWRAALGFACGSAVAYLNFHWLKRVVSGMADRITEIKSSKTGKGIVVRFLLRYAVMALTAYAILSVSPASLYGFLAGLFLPVAAVACEAVYETYVAVVRGI
ncbi:MAG TPA: ATP synthase subunit I [Terriglobales bacterium]|nr:ATP synthase subunit I [Terriglobales bacterium]